jgi:DNA-binding NtrC family response regulator
LLELAHGGTAFFDEIGELPLDLQSKLLRVLQEKEFRPLGSLSTRRSDFRIIAATNRDLVREVERGSFRQDLYYRLKVVTIKLAPLRERKEDIGLLAQHFLRKYGRNHSFALEVLDAMRAYDWPGNVRELENCLQQMVAIHTGPLLHLGDLPSAIQNFLSAGRAQAMAMAATTAGPALPKMPPAGELSSAPGFPVLPLIEMERRAIIHALEHTKGDRSVAANLLGIGRTTLYRKLKEYQLAG